MVDTARNSQNLGARVMKGAIFLAGARLVLRLFSLINLVVLGRLLSPADYGIAVLAIAVIGLFQQLSDIRIAKALISLQDIDQRHLDTAFSLALLRGLLIAGVLLAGAEPIAAVMRQPALAAVLQALALVPLLDGLRNPAFMLFQRHIDFSREVQRQIAAMVVGSIASIIAAIVLQSYWAIVIGTVVIRFVESALSWWRVPARPRLGLCQWRVFVGFGGWLTLVGLLDYLGNAAPRFLLGRFASAALLGQFSIGRDLAAIATKELSNTLSNALFPGLSTIARDPERLRSAYRQAQATIFGVAFPIGIGTAILAHELVLLLVGPKWLTAVSVIEVLSPLIALTMLNAATFGLAMAKEQTRALFVREVAILTATLPPMVLGTWFYGFSGLLAAVALRALVEVGMNMWFAKQLIGDSFWAPIVTSRRSLIAGIAMVAALLPWKTSVAASAGPGVILLHCLPLIAVGATVYATVHYLLWRIERRPPGFEARMIELARLAVRRHVAAV